MAFRHLTRAENEAIEALRREANSADRLLALVAEVFVQARQMTRISFTPRNLTTRQIQLFRSGLAKAGQATANAMTDEDLARMVQHTARWWLREYTTKALTIGAYSRQVAIAKPLNQAAASLVVIDVADTLSAGQSLERAADAARETRRAGEAAGDRAKAALASMEVLDAHHIVEKRWHAEFKDAFAKVGWATEDDMAAILIPVANHDRGLKGLVKALGVEDTLAQGLQFKSISNLLERRIVTPGAYTKLPPADRALALEVRPGVTKASEVVRKHLEVYDSDAAISRSLRSVGPDGRPVGSVAESELGKHLIQIAEKLEAQGL